MSILTKPDFGTDPRDTPERKGLKLDLPMLGIGDLQDYSGNKNNGTNNGAVWGDGPNGPVLSFDGVSDYVGVGPNVRWSDEMTITARFKQSEVPAGFDTVVSNGASNVSGGQFQFNLVYTGGSYQCWFGDGASAGQNVSVASGTFNITEYNTFTYTIGSSDIKAYLNGLLVHTVSRTLSTLYNINPQFNIGRSNSALYWPGSIEYVNYYNKALTAQEIKTQHENPWQAWEQDNIALWAAAQGGVTPTGNVNLLDGLFERKRLIA